ncbi:MAG: F420-0--gamma-glutamyl ligase [Angelakisella sp.]|jgi:F420-0:gamma-glutamyl ligase|nr:F420-0--gamma-glutamyl ligase [Angelakisella sp.]MCI9529543.1 F420-0--gamma-glutamyl ligase [Angelakisella sp.]
MERMFGTVARGVRAPIIREGDDLAAIVADTVVAALESESIPIGEKDVVAVTEAVVARAQGNYATVDQIAADVRAKLGGETIGVLFPILSRNRFSILLKGFARGAKKVVLMLSYPSDEVGNHLVSQEALDKAGVDPYRDTLTKEQFREKFGTVLHPFTGVDYIDFYTSIIEGEGAQCQVVLSNNPTAILSYTKNVLTCDIHTRQRTKAILRAAGVERLAGMDDILSAPVEGSGFNPDYGLLGSNKATEERVKLFPRDCRAFALAVQENIRRATGKTVEAMVYGDGAFKDPVGKIWELADPVVSPGFTDGLVGQPNEVKLKYLADNNFAHLTGDALREAIKEYIRQKDDDLTGRMESQGTTPRRLTDLIGSLCDLTSGSGDKGTPIVYIQGYFDNYTK